MSTEEWPAKKVRDKFVEFFATKGHKNVVSSGVVPLDDPTILFANAGMNQFKPIFLGQVDPSSDMATWKRAVNSQKCIRAGGKHNDLDDVGKDTYHHTFFEMLGNWSFGDYFKEEAIAFAWELLTSKEWYGLDPSRIYATYFGGQETPEGRLEPDNEAKEIWKKYLPEDHILPFDCADNFWEMGEVGPCGPCTELHYDRIGNRNVPEKVNMDDPDLIEIWNLVFMQFNREADRSLKPLPAKHIDTGMGFERITSILQDKPSNYDTDVFMPLFAAIKEATGCEREYTGKLGAEDVAIGSVDTAYRVIADHIRTLTFAITDGAMPDKVGRGYVLRRVVRRAVRFGRSCMGAKPGFFSKLVVTVVEMMGDAFPELRNKPDFVTEVIANEEDLFGRTLDKGEKRFAKIVKEAKAAGKEITGEQIFQLYDTFGFPLDLTVMMAEEADIKIENMTCVDGAYIVEGYNSEMKKQQEASKGKKAGAVQLVLEGEQTSWLAGKNIEPTDDSSKYTLDQSPTVEVKAIYKGKTQDSEGFADSATAGEYETIGIVMAASPFYAEQGGQIFDEGVLLADVADGDDIVFNVSNCQVFGGYVLHIGTLKGGTIKPGDALEMRVDYGRRSRIAPNHTCTHSLNYALRKVLGEGGKVTIDQRGSLNTPEYLRFDFTYKGKIGQAELAEVESIVNQDIGKNLKVYITDSPLAEAQKINTLRAVFGEHYPDPVRVVSIGAPVQKLLGDPENAEWMQYSVEFCGGTHVASLGDAMSFVITKEESVAAGIRRIQAVTGLRAQQAIAEGKAFVERVASASSSSGEALKSTLKTLLDDVNKAKDISASTTMKLREDISNLEKRQLEIDKAAAATKLVALIEEGGKLASDAATAKAAVLIVRMDALGGDAKVANKVAAEMQKVASSTVIAILSSSGSKVLCMVSVPKAMQAKAKAGDVVKAVMPTLGGKGGGKPALAQGQGSNVAAIGEAQTKIAEHLQAKLGVEASAISTVVGLAEVATPAAAETAAAPAAASSTAPIDAKTAASLSSEEYLARFDLQANLEKMVNKILQDKPANPYTAMADYLSSLPK